jgi:hypothetical protein
VVRTDHGIRVTGVGEFRPIAATRFFTLGGDSWEVIGTSARSTDSYGSVEQYERTVPAAPSAVQLQELVGAYTSAEAETTVNVAVEGGSLVIKRRPDATIRLTPVYPDAFTGQIGTVIFRRTGNRVTALSVVQDRVWDLRFSRAGEAPSTQQP